MKVPVFLQIEPRFNDDGELVSAKMVGATSGYPRSPKGGTVLVALELNVPPSAFDPIATIRIDVPESHVECHVDVETPA